MISVYLAVVNIFLTTAEHKEINKGLCSGTSSFSVSADSIRTNRAVFYIHLAVRRGLTNQIVRRGFFF